MLKTVALAIFAVCAGCMPADQPESIRYVASVEVPLRTAADRKDLLVILRRNAAADGGLHVDDVSDQWQKLDADANTGDPEGGGTIFVGVWRGADDDEMEADVSDRGHRGRAWVTFRKGTQPDRASVFRKAVLAEINRRWPDAKTLPVLPSGGLPLVEDLRLTEFGYKIARSSAAGYGLPPSSPLIAPD